MMIPKTEARQRASEWNKTKREKKMNSTNWEHIREKKITFYWITLWLSRSFSLIKHESVFARVLKYDFVFIRMRSRSGRYRRLHASISLEFVSHRLLFGATKSTTTTCAAMHCNMTCHSVLENMPVYLPYDLYAVLFNMKKYVLLHHSLMAINACIRS